VLILHLILNTRNDDDRPPYYLLPYLFLCAVCTGLFPPAP
jgi:hypothetical protein